MTVFKIASKPDPGTPLAVIVFQDGEKPTWCPAARHYPFAVLALATSEGFDAKTEKIVALRPEDKRPAERLFLLGGGKRPATDLGTLRKLAALAARRAREAKIKSFSVLLPEAWGTGAEEAQAVVEGIGLGLYRFEKHKSKPSPAYGPEQVVLVTSARPASLTKFINRGECFAQAVNYARDLINEPPSCKTPQTLGERAKDLSGGGVSVRVLQKEDLARLKMNPLLGVGRGSAHPPVLAHFHYKPSGKPKKRVALVGKGVTFDSGGLSLKPADGMMTMKYDMAGAACVFALFHALKILRPGVEVHGIAPLAENMPGGDAQKPGDVVRAVNGKTIEVLNTDAEGRLVLADALAYAAKLGVDEIIDLATLTGAATVALGRAYSALMTNNDGLETRLREAARRAGEKIWRLPLEETYRDHIKSKVADLKNIGNPGEGGTIIGGLFLQEFVGEKKWAHIDMAGVGWSNDGNALSAPGATGAPLLTLLNYIIG